MTNIPNFFIVGAAKSGTTSLADYLGQHPEIFISPVKEPFFFVNGFGLEEKNEYLKLFKNVNNETAVGEATTGYLFAEESANLIKNFNPNAKIIIILRNPVDMAFSFWRYWKVVGAEDLTFEEAISEKVRIFRKSSQFMTSCPDWFANYLYLERAQYFKQVKRYLDIFGFENVKIIIFEDFIKEPICYSRDIYEFLEVNTAYLPDCSIKKNEGGEIRFNLLKTLRNRRYPLLKKIIPYQTRMKLRTVIRDLNFKKRGKKEVVSIRERNKLNKFFKEDITSLEKLIGREIKLWKN